MKNKSICFFVLMMFAISPTFAKVINLDGVIFEEKSYRTGIEKEHKNASLTFKFNESNNGGAYIEIMCKTDRIQHLLLSASSSGKDGKLFRHYMNGSGNLDEFLLGNQYKRILGFGNFWGDFCWQIHYVSPEDNRFMIFEIYCYKIREHSYSLTIRKETIELENEETLFVDFINAQAITEDQFCNLLASFQTYVPEIAGEYPK